MDSKKLRKHYMRHLPKLNHALRHVQSQMSDLPPSEFMCETNIKPYVSVKRKMETDQVQDPLELSDLVRGRLFFSPTFRMDEVLDLVHQMFGSKVVRVDKNKHRSKEHGLKYRGVTHVDLDIDGVKFELQVMPQEFRPYKEFLHSIYEKFRRPQGRHKLSDKQKGLLRNLHNNIYRKLEEQSQSNRRPSRD